MSKFTHILTATAIGVVLCLSTAIADDGQRLVRSVSSPPGNTENPEPEGEHAFIKLMNFHVPSQAANGELVPVEYYNIDDDLVKIEEKAKPLINVYIYGPVVTFPDAHETSGYPGHGRRDGFAAVSLDDGETWKVTNLSNSADKSSFEVSTPLQDPGESESSTITSYPGDVRNIFHAVAGNKVMVAWHSKFCTGGSPVFGDTFPRDDVATYLGINNEADLYLTDLFGVAGSQGSTNYNELGAEPVGEVPHGCLWSARGVLRENPESEGTTQVVWFQAERMTSGARDVNRVETACVAGAGCAITWQEDPEGLRPGEGEGPGTGWSGATTASKTDIWYSFIEWEDFDIVDDDGSPLPLADNVLDTGRPQPYVPMMAAVRLTNNDRCVSPGASGDYCEDEVAAPYGILNQCVGSIEVPLGHQGNLQPICVVDSNKSNAVDVGDLPNLANTAASRPRLNMQPRDSDGDGVVDDAWVVVVSEEDKGLGRYGFINTEEWTLGNLEDTASETCTEPPQQPDEDSGCQKADIGKNVFWASFNLGSPNTSAGVGTDYSLVSNVLVQGAQLNQPEVNWRTGVYYPPMSTEQMWDFGDLNYLIFNTEIARRTSMMSQSVAKAAMGNGLVAMPLWKQGIVNKGGPADISARRIVATFGDEPPTECPINVDLNGPKLSSVTVNEKNKKIEFSGEGSGLDIDKDTGLIIRDATKDDVTVLYVKNPQESELGFEFKNKEIEVSNVPCYLQVADEGSDNWGPIFDMTAIYPNCEGELPEGCDDTATALTLAAINGEIPENPYSAKNMVCAWYDGEGNETPGVIYFADGSNPYYPNGLCMAAPINLSARTPYECEVSGESDGVCPGAADMTCVDDAVFGQLCSSTTNPEDNKTFDKLVTWYECPGWNGNNISGDAVMQAADCGTEPDSALIDANTDDQSWYNPLEVSKAHRGFLDANHVFMIYAWSPNWKLNAKGQDRYELYTRRSFDGGITWTTTPASFDASNGVTYSGAGTTTCETMRDGTSLEATHVCTEYAAGDPEQSRNVSQHKSMKITTLDPRYSPTVAGMASEGGLDWRLFEPIDPTDIRDPSRNFVVFESGDNTTVSEGEAEPLNLDYGRAEMFGDHFTVWSEIDTGVSDPTADCYPSNAYETTDVDWAIGTGFCNEFDTLEGFKDALSEEASITASANGDFLYGVWGQFNVDTDNDNAFIDGDSMFRRVWYLDDFISTENAYTLPGTSTK